MNKALSTVAPLQPLPAIPADVQVVTLPNGLEIVLREDHSAPVVSAQAWCRTGSIDEGCWLGGGLSHVLEHMLFKGTTTRAAGRIDQEVQAAGGYMNAYTSFDRTVYHIDTPNTGATVAVDILCDIFQNAILSHDELTRELDVIRREMDMGNDDPGRRSGRRLFETAYTQSPYRFPIIGHLDIFNRLTGNDISRYYKERYAPNNCFFVVVGDFEASRISDQIAKAYQNNAARPITPGFINTEPRQTAPREIVDEAPIEMGHFHCSWHVPEIRHPHIPALDVLATLAGSGRSSRLYRAIRDGSQLAHSISAWTYTPSLAGLWGMSGICDAAKFGNARDAAITEVSRIQQEGVTPAEVAKAIKQFTTATLSTRKTMEGQAQDLGSNWLLARDLSFSERYLTAAKSLSPDDVQNTARLYLVPENRTVFALLPQGTSPKTDTTVASRTDHPITKVVLSNGLRLITKADHRLPFVNFRLAFNGGVLAEDASVSGLSSMMAKMWLKGTQRRTADELSLEVESLGGSLEPYAGNHSLGLSAEFLNEDLATGLDLFCDVLLNPTWPEARFDRERQAQLAALRSQRDQLLQCAFNQVKRGIFGNGGYGLDLLGTEESVQRLRPEDLARLHRKLIRPSNAVLAVFGDFNPDELIAQLESSLKNWTDDSSPCPSVSPSINLERRPNRTDETRDKEQAVVVLGYPGTTFDRADRYGLELIQEACSDMGSRLFMRIRDQLGLAYYVGASQFPGRTPGYFALYCGTAPEKVDEVEKELANQAAELANSGLTAEELDRAKAKVIGQKKIARQDLGTHAFNCALDELHGLGFEHQYVETEKYRAVTLEDIQSIARTYFKPSVACTAIIRGSK